MVLCIHAPRRPPLALLEARGHVNQDTPCLLGAKVTAT